MWSQHHHALYWIDILEPALHRSFIGSDGDDRTWHFPSLIGSYALCDDDRSALVALATGIFLLDLASDRLTKVADAPYDQASYRFNDGRCDSQGRFWVGTASAVGATPADGSGWFYRLDGTGLSREIGGVTTANGIAFSPAGDVMYLADRPQWRILAFDYDVDSGRASQERPFSPIPEGQIPDGATVDRDGGYWIALYNAGRIVRISPDGTMDRDLKAPSLRPTMVAFGGADLATLFVTTARLNMTADMLASEPQAGGIFACDVGAVGMPEPRFRTASLGSLGLAGR
ncbi:MAG: gluconolactonase [Frankiales bacterium]|nr:gluconolactonase [Frankiales bacterium]